ncbi:MAG: glutathione S-transferase family protein [Rhodospirillaceae bacterium]|nr:glutathione S-transferase family protein [Rhodospirillaceae bacterium]
MLTLYHHNISVCAQKVRIALEEKQLPYEARHINLMKAEQVTPEFLKINPKGVVPAIVHDGAPVIESTVIMEYLDDAFPERPLRPAAPLARARMRVWAQVPDASLHAACGTVSYAAAFADQVKAGNDPATLRDRLARLPDRARAWRQQQLLDHGLDAPFVADAAKLHDKVLADMEKTLAGSPWLAGDTYSLAECAIVPYVLRLERLGLGNMWAGRPRVGDWYARVKARPSWAKAIVAYPTSKKDDYDDDLVAKGIDVWPKVKALIAA